MPFTSPVAATGSSKYTQVSLNDFSDDDSSTETERMSNGTSINRNGSLSNNNNNSNSRFGVNNNNAGGYSNGVDGSNDFVNGSLSRQQQLFAEQDQGLEMLGQSAERLGQMSMAIHEELGFQNKILEEMETELDEANENLDMVTKKTKEFIEKAGGTKNCLVIVALSAIAILLFFLILYT